MRDSIVRLRCPPLTRPLTKLWGVMGGCVAEVALTACTFVHACSRAQCGRLACACTRVLCAVCVCVCTHTHCLAASGNPTWYVVPGTTFTFVGNVQTNGTTTVNGALHLPRYARTLTPPSTRVPRGPRRPKTRSPRAGVAAPPGTARGRLRAAVAHVCAWQALA